MERTPGFDPKRLVAIFYVAAAVILGIFLEKVVGILFSYVRWNDRQVIGDFTVSDLAGYGSYAVAALTAWATWKNPRAQAASMDIATELNKVTWPSFRETRASTGAVLVATFIAAIILGFFDFVWGWLSAKIY